MVMDENDARKRGSGLWGDPNVPKRGWECVGARTLDRGQDSHVCDMCQSAHIRNIHFMEHPDYEDVLEVGCICSGNMENPDRAKKRETAMVNKAARRRNWDNLKGWYTTDKGNVSLKKDGFRITLYQQNGFWKILVSRGDFVKHGNRFYQTWIDAQRAAFDAFEWTKDTYEFD